MKMTDVERFWSQVDICSPDECWNWKANLNNKGYGRFKINGGHIISSRFSLQIATGSKLPKSIFACHTCDNPKCCNPAHLFPGTATDNMQDMARKGRANNGERRGEANPNCRLSDIQVAEIRMLSGTMTQAAIAQRYGCAPSRISYISRGLSRNPHETESVT